jgi:hypothetical protein
LKYPVTLSDPVHQKIFFWTSTPHKKKKNNQKTKLKSYPTTKKSLTLKNKTTNPQKKKKANKHLIALTTFIQLAITQQPI